MFKHRRYVVALCMVALLGASCASSSNTKDDAGAPQGEAPRFTIRLGADTQARGYPTPFAGIRGPGKLLSGYIFDSLTAPDVTGGQKPWLAKSWETSADGLTWTFHLNEGAKFTDGTPLTAADVQFTFEYDLTGPGAAALGSNVTYIESVTAVDPATVAFKLKSQRPSFLSDIAGSSSYGIVPKHIWSSVTDPVKFQGPTALIGSGPYKLQSFDLTANTYDFVANDDFYLGKPVVKEVQFVPVADPLLALAAGEVDAASTGNGDFVPQAQFDALSKQFKMITAQGEWNPALFFNSTKGFPYDQKAFRQGVVYALDRNDMLQRLVGGRGVPGSAGALGPANPFLNKSLPAYNFDKAKAQALFDSIDLKDRNGDGMRDRPDGSAFKIPLSVSTEDASESQLIKEYLRAVGLDVDINTVDQQTSDARGSSGDYEMAIQHFGGLSSDPSGLVSRFTSNTKSTAFSRVWGYKNPAFDQVANEQASTVDEAKRKQLVDQMQSILAEDLPQISLYVPDQITFVDAKKLGGFAYTPGCPPCGATGNKRMLVAGNALPIAG